MIACDDSGNQHAIEISAVGEDGQCLKGKGLTFPIDADGCSSGTDKNDNHVGGPKADCFNGKGGTDKVIGMAGNDKLNSGDGNDELTGGPDPDTFVCGP